MLGNLLPTGEVIPFAVVGHEIDVVTGIVVASKMLCDVTPPLGEWPEGIGRVGGFPVELRGDVVDGPFFEPCQRVAVNGAVLPVATCGTGIHMVLAGAG